MKKSNGKFLASIVLVLAVLLVLVLFALRNNELVTVDFLFATVDVSLALLILISAILGSLIIGGLVTIKAIATSSENKKLAKALDERDKEIINLEAKLALAESQKRSLEKENI